jgi:hypothetical protein
MPETRRTRLVITLVAILAAQTVLMVGATAFLLVELALAEAQFPPTAIALTGLVVLAVIWLILMTRGVWLGRAWTRGSVLVYQFLQLAVGVGSIQGYVPRPDIGGWLIAASAAGIIVVLMPSVTEYLSRRD